MIRPIFYISVDPEKSLGIEDLVPSYNIIHIGSDNLKELISYNGVNIMNIPYTDKYKYISTVQLIKNKDIQKYIKDYSGSLEPNIIVFKSDDQIEEISKKNAYLLLNPFSNFINHFENKIKAASFFDEIKIKQPKYLIIDKLSGISYQELKTKLGNSFVIQFPIGHSGNSTFFILNEEDFNNLKIKYPLRMAKASELIKGPTYTVSAVATKLGVIVAGISEQITGIEKLTPSRGGTVGNDFTQRHLDDSLRKQIIELTIYIGNALIKLGYKGIFGIDLIIDENKQIYIIELNPRQVASTSFISYLQRLNKIIPIMLWHILELIKHNYDEIFHLLDENTEEWVYQEIIKFKTKKNKLDYLLNINQPINASQVFFRNLNDYNIKITESFPIGAYRIRGRKPNEASLLEGEEEYKIIFPMDEYNITNLCFVKKAYNITQINQESFLILSKFEKTIIEPLGEIGRIQILDSVFSDLSSNIPHGWILKTIETIYENISYIKQEENNEK